MNPYSRFRLISNTATTALIAGSLCAAWPLASAMLVTAIGGAGTAYQLAVAGIAAGLVLAALAISEWIFPALFQMSFLRRIVLGKHYIEGTWLQAERGPAGSERLTVLHLRPSGYGFDLSGYSLNQESEIESNRMIEYSRLDGPVLTYAYRSLMPDGAGNQARGMGELMFEQRGGAPKAYSGHGEPIGARRFQVEGVKLTKWSERRRLRKLEQRSGIVTHYWGLYFGGPVGMAEDAAPVVAPTVRRPVIVSAMRFESAPKGPLPERRSAESAPMSDGPVITRRRASDWRSEDMTPTADRIRARMMAEIDNEIEEDELPDEEREEELDTIDAYDADDDVMLEDDEESYEEDEEELDLEDEAELDEEADEKAEFDAESEEEKEECEAEVKAFDTDVVVEPVGESATEEEPVRIRQRYARRK